MKTTTTVTDVFNCSLERAFKTPILGDATKYLTGYLALPAVAGFKADETWGKEGGSRIPLTKGNWLVSDGAVCDDFVRVRKENEYWKWEVVNFTSWTLFFAERAVGEFWVEETDQGIEVKWTYTYHSKNAFVQPLNWMFVKLLRSGLMRKGVKGMKQFAESDVDFLYD